MHQSLATLLEITTVRFPNYLYQYEVYYHNQKCLTFVCAGKALG